MTALSLFDSPGARIGDPDTSRAAAESVALSKNHDCMLVLRVLADLGGRATAFQIVNGLDDGRIWDQNVVARRCTDLRNADLIVDSGDREPGRSSRALIVWEITEAGCELVRSVAA